MKTFLCKNCGKQSRTSDMDGSGNTYFVVCEHCQATRKLIQLPTPEGAPVNFDIEQ